MRETIFEVLPSLLFYVIIMANVPTKTLCRTRRELEMKKKVESKLSAAQGERARYAGTPPSLLGLDGKCE